MGTCRAASRSVALPLPAQTWLVKGIRLRLAAGGRGVLEGAQAGYQSLLQFHHIDFLDEPVIVGGIAEHRPVFEAVGIPTGEARRHVDGEARKIFEALPVDGGDRVMAAVNPVGRHDLGIPGEMRHELVEDRAHSSAQ